MARSYLERSPWQGPVRRSTRVDKAQAAFLASACVPTAARALKVAF
jgi:hypothetical protein